MTHRPSANLERLDVLVVDDYPSLRRLIVEVLGEDGLVAAGVGNGVEALSLLSRAAYRPRVVITDLEMPGIGGRELIRRMRMDRALARVPILLMTAAVAVPPLGRDIAVLRKPFSLDMLVRCVREALATVDPV